MLGALSPPNEIEVMISLPYKEVDIRAAIRAYPALSGIGGLLRPRQEAVSLLSEALHEGYRAASPRTPFLAPKWNGAPWAILDPGRKRASEAERSR